MYMSLTENKVNRIYDDLENNIADLDKEARYELLVPEETQIFAIGDVITPSYTLTKNGEVCDYATVLVPGDKKVAKMVRGVLTAVGEGETDITVELKDFPLIQKTIHIVVSDEEKGFYAYIEGAASIKLDYGEDAWKTNTYFLQSSAPLEGMVSYFIDKPDYATIIKVENNVCYIQANRKNNLGPFTLVASYNGKNYTKDITVVPIW